METLPVTGHPYRQKIMLAIKHTRTDDLLAAYYSITQLQSPQITVGKITGNSDDYEIVQVLMNPYSSNHFFVV
jgi:hypothetical protein